MTEGERGILEQLRADLHGYHVEVREHIAKCSACRGDVARIAADLYGIPGEDENPGLKGDVAELRRGRKIMLLGLRGAWVVLTIILSAAVAAAFRQ